MKVNSGPVYESYVEPAVTQEDFRRWRERFPVTPRQQLLAASRDRVPKPFAQITLGKGTGLRIYLASDASSLEQVAGPGGMSVMCPLSLAGL